MTGLILLSSVGCGQASAIGRGPTSRISAILAACENMARLAPPMRFVKVEGDAPFLRADQAAFIEGDRFIELIESC